MHGGVRWGAAHFIGLLACKWVICPFRVSSQALGSGDNHSSSIYSVVARDVGTPDMPPHTACPTCADWSRKKKSIVKKNLAFHKEPPYRRLRNQPIRIRPAINRNRPNLDFQHGQRNTHVNRRFAVRLVPDVPHHPLLQPRHVPALQPAISSLDLAKTLAKSR